MDLKAFFISIWINLLLLILMKLQVCYCNTYLLKLFLYLCELIYHCWYRSNCKRATRMHICQSIKLFTRPLFWPVIQLYQILIATRYVTLLGPHLWPNMPFYKLHICDPIYRSTNLSFVAQYGALLGFYLWCNILLY